MSAINPSLVVAAFHHIDGDAFERFFKEFGTSVYGMEFTPLGGKSDGGADGFGQRELFSSSRRLTYFQATVQDNHVAKLKQTVRRLSEYGRDVGTLYYFTSRLITDVDNESMRLSAEHNTTIVIHDGQWIANRINSSNITQALFENHLRFFAASHSGYGSNTGVFIPSEFNRSAAVFISQHILMVSNKEGVRGLVLDSLILFVLEDATANNLLHVDSIFVFDRMRQLFPTGFSFSDNEVSERLALLSTKSHPGGRQVVWDSRSSAYTLPFDVRDALAAEHASFEALIYTVKEEI